MANEMVKDQLSESEVQLIQKEREAEKTQPKDTKKGKAPVNPKTKQTAKGKESVSETGMVSVLQSHGASSAKSLQQTKSPVLFNAEVAGILKELHNNQNKISNRLEKLSSRVDSIYEYTSDEYDEQYVIDGNQNEYYDDAYENVVPESSDHDQSVETASVASEPPLKKQKSEKASVFKNIHDKFNPKEIVDVDINSELAEFINTAFGEGISEDKQSELLKEIHRPNNCSTLVKTTVNQPIWRLLKAHTQTDDVKMQLIQNNIIKAAISFTKILNECGESIGQDMIELGMNALAHLGQSNKQINSKRKEFHKVDLDVKYHYLTSQNLPFTDKVYGDDVNKNIKDIQDINRLSKNIGRGTNMSTRSGYRGRRLFRFPQGRGRAHGRGYGCYNDQQQHYGVGSSTSGTLVSKNRKTGTKKWMIYQVRYVWPLRQAD